MNPRNAESSKRGWIVVTASAGCGELTSRNSLKRFYSNVTVATIVSKRGSSCPITFNWSWMFGIMPLVKLINGWKGKSSREANKLLRRRGAFWQEDYYDTLVRDEAHLKRAVRYTEQNPVKARRPPATGRGAAPVIVTNTNACRGSATRRARHLIPLQRRSSEDSQNF